jgi:hypothetical protein
VPESKNRQLRLGLRCDLLGLYSVSAMLGAGVLLVLSSPLLPLSLPFNQMKRQSA